MKKFRTLSATAILICMLFSLLSCTAEAPETVPDYTSEVELDYTGYEIIMMVDNSYIGEEEYLGYPVDSLFADLARERVKEVEEKTKCDITIEYQQDTEMQSILTYSIASNGTRYSAMQFSNWTFTHQPMIRAGMFYPLSMVSAQINYLDEEKWGNKYLLGGLCWDNDVYGVIPILWPEYALRFADFLVTVNVAMASKAGCPDPREFVENKEWTREKLKQCVEDFAIVEQGETKVYGFACNLTHIYDVTFFTSGFEHARKEGDTWVSDVFTEDFIREMTWVQNDLIDPHKDIIYTGETAPVVELFGDEKAAMILMHSQFIFEPGSKVAYSGIPFAILPYPLSDDLYAKDSPWRSLQESIIFGTSIPITCEDPSAAAYIINELYEPLPGFETQDDREDYYLKNVFHDKRDMDIYFSLFEHCQYTFRAEGVTDLVHEMGSRSVTQAIESKENQYRTAMEEYVIPMTESRIAVFGE